MTPDVNVLVAASRADHPHHSVAHAWLVDALGAAEAGARLVVLPMVAAGFLRVVTQERVFPVPTPARDAIAFAQHVLDAPGVEMATLGPEWPRVVQLCDEHALHGTDVTDAWIAAAVIDHHEHLVTFDRGFRRFLAARDLTLLAA